MKGVVKCISCGSISDPSNHVRPFARAGSRNICCVPSQKKVSPPYQQIAILHDIARELVATDVMFGPHYHAR